MAVQQQGAPTRQLRADARRNVERLIVAADAEFAKRGSAASLDEIAKRAGVGPGTLYRHFPTRAVLIEAVLRNQFQSLHEQATALSSTTEPDLAIEEWLRLLLANAMTHHGVAAPLLSSAIDNPSSLSLPDTCRQIHADGEALVAMAQEAGTIRDDVTFSDIARLFHGIALSLTDAPDSGAVTERLFQIALDGIRSQPMRKVEASPAEA